MAGAPCARKGRQPLQWKRPCRPPSFFIQNHYAKSGAFGFFKTNSEIVRIALLRSNGRKGRAPSMAGGPCRPRSSSKSIAPNRELGVFGTNSGSINEPLMGGSFFCGERGGDRSIGEANLRKGAALQWLAHLAPVRGVSPYWIVGG